MPALNAYYAVVSNDALFFILLLSPFYRATACNATHGIAVAILSVRPSVCLSVRQMRVL